MINLYIINESSRAAVYGIGTYIRELTAALKSSDVNVCIVHLRSNKPKNKTEETDGIQHLYIPPPINRNTFLDWNKQSELYYRNVVYLFQLLIKDKKNLIFHLNYNQSGKLAEELKNAFNCRIVTTVHYSNWGFSIYDNLRRFRSILNEEQPDENVKKMIDEERSYYSKADRVVCLSNYMQKILFFDYGIDPVKISLIPNGLTDVKKVKVSVNDLKKKWNIPSKEKIIFYAGRMDEIKGLTYLLKSFREILKIYSNCRLIIAGSASFDKYTKESQDICTKITYTGFLDKTKLYEWYR